MKQPNVPILPSYLQKIVDDIDYSGGKKIAEYTKDRYNLESSDGKIIQTLYIPLPIR